MELAVYTLTGFRASCAVRLPVLLLQAHIGILETPETQQQLLAGLDYLVNISYVDNTEVFKTCLDYW